MSFKPGHTEFSLSFTLLCAAAICAVAGVMKGFLWCMAAIALHEGGHLLAMRRFGYLPDKIRVSLFEIAIFDSGRERRRTRENVWIIFFGPFANFICFSVSFLLYLGGMKALLPFAAANLSVGLFNCLPVLSLDGGQLLYLLLCRRHTVQAAEMAVNAAAFMCIFPLAALGFAVLLHSRWNISLLMVTVYLMLSLVLGKDRCVM